MTRPIKLLPTPFEPGDKVHIDGDESIRATVTGICWMNFDGLSVKVSWIHNGAMHENWVHMNRVKLI